MSTIASDARIDACERAGIPRARLIVDPGIGFGKTLAHNLALLGSLEPSSTGSAAGVMLGASRKSFIGKLTGAGGRIACPAPSPRLSWAQRRACRSCASTTSPRRARPLAVWEGRAAWCAGSNAMSIPGACHRKVHRAHG